MRRKPYSEQGISRVPCFRCGQPSDTQWQICALSNEYKGVCTACDLDLNNVILEFFKVPDREQIMLNYIKKVTE